MYQLDRLDRIGWIVLVLLLVSLGETGNWIATGWMGQMYRIGQGWDGGGMEGPTLAGGAGTGAPPLALEGGRAAGIGGWHQLRQCSKGAEYFFHRSKIIQISCTKIGTNT